MEDKILEMFFEKERWASAIEKGVLKNINKAELYNLTQADIRAQMYLAIVSGNYEIAPPHTAKIPKDTPGEFRTVYVNEPVDRIFLSIANDLLFELTPDMIHPACKSYQKGIGCGKVVKEVSRRIVGAKGDVIGWKSDLSKYFDSVPLYKINQAFDMVEHLHGHSVIIDVLRKYYHSDYYFDTDGELRSAYQSLKQGCAVASWLANVILYDIDETISRMDGYYVRYSDDMLFIGPDYEKAMQTMGAMLAEMNMRLNPGKVEYLTRDRWFKFLGFAIKGGQISLSGSRIKKFQKEIESRTINDPGMTPKKALNSVIRYLYKGDGQYSWATQILPVCNVKKDIHELDKFVKDCLRAVKTKKRKLGGLGYVPTQHGGCISRGVGQHVTSNRKKTEPMIEGYISLGCAQNALLTNRDAYRTLVLGL